MSTRKPSGTLLVDDTSPVGTMAKPVDPATLRQPLAKFTAAAPLPVRKPPPGMVVCPEPGVYPGTSFETYLSWDAMNHSTLKHIKKSPRKLKFHRDHPVDKKTPSKRMGSGTHELFLEPDRFNKRVIAGPVNDKTGKCYGSDTKAWGEFEDAHPGKMVLSHEDMASMALMAAEIGKHPQASKLLWAPGQCEVCIVWDCPTTGLRCKARIDKVVQAFGWLDLKTTESAAEDDFEKSMVNYDYVTQFPFYDMGVEALRAAGKLTWGEHVATIAVETSEDHDLSVFDPKHDEFGEISRGWKCGRSIVMEWLETLRQCLVNESWPGYPREVRPINPPEYFLRVRGFGMDDVIRH